ncbi:MAG: protein kinase [Actinomycetota bacterium]|nr:protein kinase [Actinomycetota bacterium]
MSSQVSLLADRYLLEARIAAGGMATVWLARDEVLARPVAVKLLHPHLARGPVFLQRFKQEAIAAAQLSHPRIVSIFDTGTASGSDDDTTRPFIVMEYCSGGTLASLLTEEGPLEPGRAVAVMADICDALAHAHRYGIVHRDIKPANILLTRERELKVADFGIAKAAFDTTDLTRTGSILGSVAYISPEQIEGAEPDQRSDIYAMGVLLYELLAGRPPFAGESHLGVAMAHVHEQPPSLRGLRAQIPRRTEQMVMKALSKDPDQRFSTAEDMRLALGESSGATALFAASSPSDSSTAVTGVRSPQEGGRHPGSTASQTRNLIPIFVVVATAVLLGVVLPRVFDGGGLGRDTAASGNGSADARSPILEVSEPRDFDPLGDGEEHSEDVSAAVDGNPGTYWTTESYDSGLGKAGVGLLFDLGRSRAVRAAVITSDTPGMTLELRSADRAPSDAAGMTPVGKSSAADKVTRLDAEGQRARYWLVWITELPDALSSAHIGEVRFFGI